MNKINYRYIRCNICDRADTPEISDDMDEVHFGAYYPDPHGDGYLCGDCVSEIVDVRKEWNMIEEANENDGSDKRSDEDIC